MPRVRETVWKGDRGGGTIFFRLDREGHRLSPNLYIAYRAQGQEYVVSVLTDDVGEAKRELKRLTRNRDNAREGKEALVTPRTERVTIGELLDANLRRAEEEGLASVRGIRYRTATLKSLLGSIRAVEYRSEHTDRYKAKRREGKSESGKRLVGETAIKHELEILNAAFKYAVRRGVLRFAPFVEKPTEDIVREKEIPLDAVPSILKAIACPDVRDFAEWLLLTATRPKGVRLLRWDWLDTKAWELRVPSEKGGNAREFAVEGSLRRVIEQRIGRRRLDCPYIFHHKGRALGEDRVRAIFYHALRACGFEPGREGFTLYDLKKTAAGVLIDAGLTEHQAMHFSGHKTSSMFDRYVIKSTERHRAQVRKRDSYLTKRLADKKPGYADKVVKIQSKLEIS